MYGGAVYELSLSFSPNTSPKSVSCWLKLRNANWYSLYASSVPSLLEIQRKEIRKSRIGIHMLFDQFHRFRQKSHSQHSACFPPTISKDISVYIMFFQISKIDERHTTQQKTLI